MHPSDDLLQALEKLYRARFAHFVRVAQAIVGDRERAVEAVQDAFASAVAGRSGFRGEGSLEAWVWRGVVNAARKTTRRSLVGVHELEGEARELQPSRPDLAPLVSALPERQRLVVFLRYYADLEYRDIAKALGVEVGTVSATLAAAHAALRNQLEEAHSG